MERPTLVRKQPTVKTLVFFHHFASCILMKMIPFLIERGKRSERETERHRQTERDRERQSLKERLKERQTDGQTDRQTDRQKDLAFILLLGCRMYFL